MIITNTGTVNATVDLSGDTTLTGYFNGSPTDTSAKIIGTTLGLYDGRAIPLTSVTNYGGITTTGSGYSALSIAVPITLSNYGSIVAGTSYLAYGALLVDGSTVNNYSGGVISGYIGLGVNGGTTTLNVTNQGRITGAGGAGVSIGGPGSQTIGATRVNNGTTLGSTALMSGTDGFDSNAPAVLNNYGSILGTAGNGVLISTGANAPTWVFNYNTISGTSKALNAFGVYITTGAIVNGAPNDITATITGNTGVAMQQSNNLTNYGHITGTTGYGASMSMARLRMPLPASYLTRMTESLKYPEASQTMA